MRGFLSPLGQAVLLGGTGFVAGYVFPVLRMPYANQGPLMGFLLTGPAGFCAGLILGLLGKGFRWGPAAAAWLLVACCLLLGVATYVACEPNDDPFFPIGDHGTWSPRDRQSPFERLFGFARELG